MDTILKKTGTIHHDDRAAARPRLARLAPFTGLLDRLFAWFETRRQLQHLTELDDRLLRDIGVRREDALQALREHARKGPGQ